MAPVAALGEYAGAERITRVFQQGMWPVNQALYPRLTKQMQDSPGKAMKTVKYSLLLLGGLGMIFGLAIYLGAPLLVRFVLGPAFRDSVPVLRVFSMWIPMIALTTVMIFQLLLPNQLDTQFNFVNYSAGGLGILVAFLLVPRMAAVGIAWAAVDFAGVYPGSLYLRVVASRVESVCRRCSGPGAKHERSGCRLGDGPRGSAN